MIWNKESCCCYGNVQMKLIGVKQQNDTICFYFSNNEKCVTVDRENFRKRVIFGLWSIWVFGIVNFRNLQV